MEALKVNSTEFVDLCGPVYPGGYWVVRFLVGGSRLEDYQCLTKKLAENYEKKLKAGKIYEYWTPGRGLFFEG